jgi:hypothetical protein
VLDPRMMICDDVGVAQGFQQADFAQDSQKGLGRVSDSDLFDCIVGEQVAIEDMPTAIDHATLTAAELGFLDKEAGKVSRDKDILWESSFRMARCIALRRTARSRRPTGRWTSSEGLGQDPKVVCRPLGRGCERSLCWGEGAATKWAKLGGLAGNGQTVRVVDADVETLAGRMPFDHMARLCAPV